MPGVPGSGCYIQVNSQGILEADSGPLGLLGLKPELLEKLARKPAEPRCAPFTHALVRGIEKRLRPNRRSWHPGPAAVAAGIVRPLAPLSSAQVHEGSVTQNKEICKSATS